MTTPLWTPDPADVARAQVTEFATMVSERTGLDLSAYADLQAWSVSDLDTFWRGIWDYFGVVAQTESDTVLADDSMPGAVWFPGAELNYAANVFRDRAPDGVAIRGVREDHDTVEITWERLESEVGSVAAALRDAGVGQGDRVVGFMPNVPEAVVAFLAVASIGAIWSACGTDYAPDAAIARFAQLEPVAFITANGFRLAGKDVERAEAVARIRAGLPGLRTVIALNQPELPPVADALDYREVVAVPRALDITPVPFDHPLWVLFSSGTTGVPKGIVHGHGGVVLEQLKTIGLQLDLRPGNVLFWFTSPSWMMWNFQVGALLHGVTIVTYDGSPAHPSTDGLWALAARERATVLGTSPGYVAACSKAGAEPARDHDLSALRVVGVTGSTLPEPGFHWLSEHVGNKVHINPTSGGTDVVAAFVGGAPSVPVWAGEISTFSLGSAVDAFDPEGRSIRGEVGELVVTRPMPTMPLFFWNDPDGSRLRDSYFDTYPGVWRHGDWVTITERGSILMHGRSDATLNRNGIRMGSADIYEAVEQLPEVVEALVLGIEEDGGGYWMPMFVTLVEGVTLDEPLDTKIRKAVREHASPRHVPDEIHQVRGIPHTRTGKKLEVPLKKLITGRGDEKTFDPGSVDDPTLIEEFLAIGAQHNASRS